MMVSEEGEDMRMAGLHPADSMPELSGTSP